MITTGLRFKDIYAIAMIAALSINFLDFRAAILFTLPLIITELAIRTTLHRKQRQLQQSQFEFIKHLRNELIQDNERRNQHGSKEPDQTHDQGRDTDH